MDDAVTNTDILVVNKKNSDKVKVEQVGSKAQLYGSQYALIIVYGDVNQEWFDLDLMSRLTRGGAIVRLTEDGEYLETIA
jgi:hypothetical protein